MTKSQAGSFLREVASQAGSEFDLLRAAVQKGPGALRARADGARVIDVALPGTTSTQVPSMRDHRDQPPAIKLRRFLLAPSASQRGLQAIPASAGVDLEAAAYEALAARKAAKSGLEGFDLHQDLAADLLDRAQKRQAQFGASRMNEEFRVRLPDGVVSGVSRSDGKQLVDDYTRFKGVPDRDPPQRERQRALSPSRGERPAGPVPDLATRVREAAERKQARLQAARTRQPAKGDEQEEL